MELKEIKAVYFVGAGGIGMSALVRYFINKGMVVAGYDKTPSELTRQLENEGALLHYEEDVQQIPRACRDARQTLVIYTPAVPDSHKELVYFRSNGFEIQKRAHILDAYALVLPQHHHSDVLGVGKAYLVEHRLITPDYLL